MNKRLRDRIVSTLCALAVMFSVIVPTLSSSAEESILPVSALETEEETAEETVPEQETTEPEEGFEDQSIELLTDIEEKSVTLNGIMPAGASATAVDVTEDYADIAAFAAEDTGETSASVLAAYDITITDGQSEYQPDESHPILVEIIDPLITANGTTELWHILDNGEREQITDLIVEEGRISFYAFGFSVYAIVEAPEPLEIGDGHVNVTSVDELYTEDEETGFYLYYVSSTGTKMYCTNTEKGNGALKETSDIDQASLWYFEPSGDGYSIYTYVNGAKKYIKTTSGNNIQLASTGDVVVISQVENSNSFYIKKANDSRWLQHSGGGDGMRYYTDNKNSANSSIFLYYSQQVEVPDDYYDLDGKTYGLMRYLSGSTGAALAVGEDNNVITLYDTVVVSNGSDKSYYVSDNQDVTFWTFHNVDDNRYKISAEIDGETKYMKLTESGITVVDEADASVIRVEPKANRKVVLSCGNLSLSYNGSGFTVDTTGSVNNNNMLNFIEQAELTNNDSVSYSAQKISVSDVQNGQKVIVYTRKWNDTTKKYEYYAIDHDGTLHRCYENGNEITWIESPIDTLEWKFTEYYYEGTSTPNNYYELYNTYSHKYLVPKLDGAILSDNAEGINLNGRRRGEYSTSILSWEEDYYAYAGLKTNDANTQGEGGYKSEAEQFYFAVVEPMTPTLTDVETVDNNEYGITMRMVDFSGKAVQYPGASSLPMLHEVMGITQYNSSNPIAETRGLLSNFIGEDGYPYAMVPENHPSLGTLFNSTDAIDVNHLFIQSIYDASGYFEFDSAQNFASLVATPDNNFTVYKELGTATTAGRPTMKHGQFFPFNTISPDKYSTGNPQNLYAARNKSATQVMELPDSDPRKYERLYGVDSPNYYFGMEVSANFFQTPDGEDAWGHDMIFEFNGDDDFWFYVDDQLVIDLGGIHSAIGGSVNYKTGEVIVNGRVTNLREIFESNYLSAHPDATNAETEEYLNGIFKPGTNVFKDYSSHTMKIYYMERGAGASNLHMRFNLSSVSQNNAILTKKVLNADDLDYALVEYPFCIWYSTETEMPDNSETGTPLRNTNGNKWVTYRDSTQDVTFKESYTPPNSQHGHDNIYMIDPDKKALIEFPDGTKYYRVMEVGINSEVYDKAYINGVDTPPTAQTDHENETRKCYDSGWLPIDQVPNIEFENEVNPDSLRTLNITKILHDAAGKELTEEEDNSLFQFRLYLSGEDPDSPLIPADMHKYYVKDPDGYYCKWDMNLRRLVPTQYNNLMDIHNEEDLNAVTHETSANGSIDCIAAGYQVEVMGLPVGTRFMVEEREAEIPLGYRLEGYHRDEGSYITEGEDVNSGRIRANESPSLFVNNRRGFGLQADKEWAHKDYVENSEIPDIYVAVFNSGDNTPVAGSVRKLHYPATSVKYYYDSLENGKDFSDYVIREVKLTDPVTDADGTVTSYSSLQRLENNSTFTSGSDQLYYVGYETGELAGGSENARTDTITNTPQGGIAFRLFQWNSDTPLPGGKFTIKQNGTPVGASSYESDENGDITAIYSFRTGVEYLLTETSAPDGYQGLTKPVKFTVNSDNTVTIISEDGTGWVDIPLKPDPENKYLGFIDIHNRRFELCAVKTDAARPGVTLAGAHFALYRSVNSGLNGEMKAYDPIPGYEDLVTEANGIIPMINSTLQPGKYYLTEKTAPAGYNKLENDIVFTITSTGRVIIESTGHADFLTTTEEGGTIRYELNVPNTPSTAEITVTKKVEGNLGNKKSDFSFNLTVSNAAASDRYSWKKNGVVQSNKLRSGGTFTLRDGDTVVIELPVGETVSFTELNGEYDTTFQLGDSAPENGNRKSFVVVDAATVTVVNTLDGIVPTGVGSGLPGAVTAIATGAGVNFLARRRRRKTDEEV